MRRRFAGSGPLQGWSLAIQANRIKLELPPARGLLIPAALAVLIVGAYWPILWTMGAKWLTNPQYAHGLLVPLFAAYLLWQRRELVAGKALEGSWWGLCFLVAGIGLHLAGAYLYFDWFSMAAILPLVTGLFLVYGGKTALRWAWLPIAFLAFMLPLPFRVEKALSAPLQRLATIGSTYILQTLGFPALSEGNTILLEESRLGVIEACNGLGMLVTFFALTTAVAILIKPPKEEEPAEPKPAASVGRKRSGPVPGREQPGKPAQRKPSLRARLRKALAALVRRPALDRAVIVLSAVPIALTANVLRITATAILHDLVGGEAADVFFHDLGGWLMMPLALGLLWIELQILKRLLVESGHNSVPAVFVAPRAKPETQRGPGVPSKSKQFA